MSKQLRFGPCEEKIKAAVLVVVFAIMSNFTVADSLLSYVNGDPFHDSSAFSEQDTPPLGRHIGITFSAGSGGAKEKYKFNQRSDSVKWNTDYGNNFLAASYIEACYRLPINSGFDAFFSLALFYLNDSVDAETDYIEKHFWGGIERKARLSVKFEEIVLDFNVLVVTHATSWLTIGVQASYFYDKFESDFSDLLELNAASPISLQGKIGTIKYEYFGFLSLGLFASLHPLAWLNWSFSWITSIVHTVSSDYDLQWMFVENSYVENDVALHKVESTLILQMMTRVDLELKITYNVLRDHADVEGSIETTYYFCGLGIRF